MVSAAAARSLTLLAALVMSGAESRWVLCIGPGGHIGVEAQDAGCCHASRERLEPAGVDRDAGGVVSSSGAPCTDIPLHGGTLCEAAPPAAGARIAPACPAARQPAACSPSEDRGPLRVEAPLATSAPGGGMLRLLRTVILCC